MALTLRQQTLNMPPPPALPRDIADADIVNIITHPTNTYRLEYGKRADAIDNLNSRDDPGRIRRDIDGLMAMEQFVYKVIFTERYEFLTYNWNYGIELKGLFGQQQALVRAELPRVITEALINDDRVTAVRDFIFINTKEKETVAISFTVETIYGDITIEPIFSFTQARFISKTA